jgi:integrase
LLAVLGAAKKESQRDHALLLVCYSHAMRANECGKLLVSDVSIKDQTIRIARSWRPIHRSSDPNWTAWTETVLPNWSHDN